MTRIILTTALFTLLLPVFALASPVPELDPASASSAIAILMGFGLIARDRFRKR
jgi:hypothetical protein